MDLLPCPFCNGKAVIDSGLARKEYGSQVFVGFAFAKCEACGVSKGQISDAPDEAAAVAAVSREWNTRANGDLFRSLVELAEVGVGHLKQFRFDSDEMTKTYEDSEKLLTVAWTLVPPK